MTAFLLIAACVFAFMAAERIWWSEGWSRRTALFLARRDGRHRPVLDDYKEAERFRRSSALVYLALAAFCAGAVLL